MIVIDQLISKQPQGEPRHESRAARQAGKPFEPCWWHAMRSSRTLFYTLSFTSSVQRGEDRASSCHDLVSIVLYIPPLRSHRYLPSGGLSTPLTEP